MDSLYQDRQGLCTLNLLDKRQILYGTHLVFKERKMNNVIKVPPKVICIWQAHSGTKNLRARIPHALYITRFALGKGVCSVGDPAAAYEDSCFLMN